MKVTILCVGKIKEKFYREAIDEFIKRLSKYCKLSICEVVDEMTPDHASESEETIIKEKEGARILKNIDEKAYVIALTIDGKQMDSVEMSEMISQIGINGCSHIAFVIGGSLGLSREVLQRADRKLSFSKMTFPHQLMRVILLEQIYRSYRIMNHEPYHK